jgi:hypothetical protein
MKTAPIACLFAFIFTTFARADDWKNDRIWYDGLVEKATYTANRVVYGKAREYEAIFFTNKEQHDRNTLTKANRSKATIEVWKHNQIEDIPTPNYHYHYVTTTHLSTRDMRLTRMDCSSQEFCGTSFKQYELHPGDDKLSFFLFSYMPEQGKVEGSQELEDRFVVPADSLPLWLRDFDFVGRETKQFWIIESQKSNRQTQPAVNPAEARFAAEEPDAFQLVVVKNGQPIGTWWMAKDRLHVMLKYESGDRSQKYELKSLERVNYWTIKGE